MLTFKQFIALMEGLNPVQKKAVSSWIPDGEKVHAPEGFASRAAVNLSSHIIPEGQHHIIIPMIKDNPIVDTVKDHLEFHGYTIHDLNQGLAIKYPTQKQLERAEKENRAVKPQKIKIAKALKATGADQSLIDSFSKLKKGEYHILLSREANAVAGCSTDKPWKSCAKMGDAGELTGAAAGYLPREVIEGTHVAYLIPSKFEHLSHDEQIDKAVSRILLKPHYGEKSGTSIIYPENKMYGQQNKFFIDTLHELMRSVYSHLPQDDFYKKSRRVYNDDDVSRRNVFFNTDKAILSLNKKLNDGIFDTDHFLHAYDNEYINNETLNKAKKLLIHKVKTEGLDPNYLEITKKINHNVGGELDDEYDGEDENHTDGHVRDFYDDDVKEAFKRGVIHLLNNDHFDRNWVEEFYKEFNSDKNDKDVKEASVNALVRDIQKGNLDDDHLRLHANDVRVKSAMADRLATKIQNGTYTDEDLNHARRYRYNTDDKIITPLESKLITKLDSGKITLNDLNHAFQFGYFTKTARETSKRALLNGLNNGIVNIDHLKHASQSGYFADDVKEASKQALIHNLNIGNVDIDHLNHATNNSYLWGPVKEASKQALIDNLNNGIVNIDHLKHAFQSGYFADDVKEASKQALIHNLNNGIVNVDHLDHADGHHYSSNEVSVASKQALIHNLNNGIVNIPHLRRVFDESRHNKNNDDIQEASKRALIHNLNNGIVNVDHLNHCNGYYYCDKDVKEASKRALIHNLNNGILDWGHIEHAKKYGYYDDDVIRAFNR